MMVVNRFFDMKYTGGDIPMENFFSCMSTRRFEINLLENCIKEYTSHDDVVQTCVFSYEVIIINSVDDFNLENFFSSDTLYRNERNYEIIFFCVANLNILV